MRCNIFQSVNHWALECLGKEVPQVSCVVNVIVLHESNVELKSLVSGTWNAALLACGATCTV